MNTSKLSKTLSVAAVAFSLLSFSAKADDYDRYGDRHEGHGDYYGGHHHHHDGDRVGVSVGIGGLGVNVGSHHRHYRHEGVVVISESESRYDHSVVFDVQRRLLREGYYRSSIDGDIGPGTRSSIRAYQRDHGLAPSGYINDELLVSLRIR